MLDRRVLGAGLAVLLLSALPAAAQDDSFTVSGVHEDVTAASALVARDQATAEGQRKAFETLIGRVAGGKMPHLSADQITDMVIGYEVANEHASSVRYVADYTFHFRPSAVRRYMGDAVVVDTGNSPMATGGRVGSPAAPPDLGRPLLVLPVYFDGSRAVLWDDPNPWRDAWTERSGRSGGQVFTVPAGDLPDVAAIDAPKALAGDPQALEAISGRYQHEDVLVLRGKFIDSPRRFEVTGARYQSNDPTSAPPLVVLTTARPGESDLDLMKRAVFNVIGQLGQTARMNAAAPADTGDGVGGAMLTATVPSGSLAEWVTVRNRLRGIPMVRGADLVSIEHNRIHVAIHYSGDPGQLRAALRDRNLELGGADPDWTLMPALRAAASPPPPPSATPASAGAGNNLAAPPPVDPDE